MIWVYVLYMHHRMILEEIEAPSLMDADKILSGLIAEKVEKRNNIGCYPLHLFPKQREADLIANFCSH